MKRRYLIPPIFILSLILAFTLLPISFISADSTITYDDAGGLPDSGEGPDTIYFHFNVTSTSKFSNAILRMQVDNLNSPGEQDAAYFTEPDCTEHYLGFLQGSGSANNNEIIEVSLDPSWIKNGQNDVRVEIDSGWFLGIDDAWLILTKKSGGGAEEEVAEPAVWVRDHEMQCWQVWINEDNAFEFVFVWEYANNNHVQIFDMAGNLVFETDMQKDSAHFVAALPDGMYTVKTFHEYGHILQEFVIGKP